MIAPEALRRIAGDIVVKLCSDPRASRSPAFSANLGGPLRLCVELEPRDTIGAVGHPKVQASVSPEWPLVKAQALFRHALAPGRSMNFLRDDSLGFLRTSLIALPTAMVAKLQGDFSNFKFQI